MNNTTNSVLVGSLAGLAGTVPMSIAMEALHRTLPTRERYSLPPRQIAMKFASATGGKLHMNEPQKVGLTLVSHFSYGAVMGALYGPLARTIAPTNPMPAPVTGAAFGLIVWAGSYLGLLPALRILSPATRHPLRRTALMITVHLLWGSVTGWLTDHWQREGLSSGLAGFSRTGSPRTRPA